MCKMFIMINLVLFWVISEIGYIDLIVVMDVGFFILQGVECIDFVYWLGVFVFFDVFDIVFVELVVEGVIVLVEVVEKSLEVFDVLWECFVGMGFEIEFVLYWEFKQCMYVVCVFVCFGEFILYVNVILYVGVVY